MHYNYLLMDNFVDINKNVNWISQNFNVLELPEAILLILCNI